MEHFESRILENQPKTSKSKYLYYDGKVAVFHTRRINPTTNTIEVWECKWSNPADGKPKKVFVKKINDEDKLDFHHGEYSTAEAICWAPGTTIGNIAVNNKEMLGVFSSQSQGNDAILPCQIIPCGKYRNGKPRWYCKTHQVHWGTLADIAAARQSETGELECSSRNLKMNYVVKPLDIEFKDFEEIGIWCSLPAALSSKLLKTRPPRIHIHRRKKGESKKDIDADFEALVLSYSPSSGLFQNDKITKIQVTPPSALEFIVALEEGREVSCVSCKKCGYPHLDLGNFAKEPHAKHYCGNCGNDSVWSTKKIVSTPLKPLHDLFHKSNSYIDPERTLNLDDYAGYPFDIWASTPAIIWTADRPQEKGIHVHVYGENEYIIDDTYSQVIFQGQTLDRKKLWAMMLANTAAA